jgi:hypothetical protein
MVNNKSLKIEIYELLERTMNEDSLKIEIYDLLKER